MNLNPENNFEKNHLTHVDSFSEHNSITKSISDLKIALKEGPEAGLDAWQKVDKDFLRLGFKHNDPEAYFLNVSRRYGASIVVRRSNLEKELHALETGEPFRIQRHDTEPNAALLGTESKEDGSSKISGIEAAMTGGFGSVAEGVSGVFGFMPITSDVKISELPNDSPSLTKKHGEVMKGVEGTVNPEDILFILLRIHHSAFPDELCEDDDFDSVTGDKKPFILRLYTKNRQTQ